MMKSQWTSRLRNPLASFNVFLSQPLRSKRQGGISGSVESLEARCLLTAIWNTDFDGDWENPDNWLLHQVPQFGDNVIIDRPGFNPVVTIHDTYRISILTAKEAIVVSSTGSLRVDSFGTIESSLTLSPGSTLNAVGTLTVTNTGTIDWQGGEILGSGLVNDGTINITAATDVHLAEGMTNNATVNHFGAGTIRMDNNRLLTNSVGAVFNFAGDGDFGSSGFGGGQLPLFQNNGTLRKSAGLGVTTFDGVTLNCPATGVIDIDMGTLGASGSGTWAGSTFTGNGGTVEVSGSYAISGTLTGTGTGHLKLVNTFNGASSGATLNFPAGYFQWASGNMFGPGSGITNAGFMSILGTSDVRIGGTFTNNGTVTQSGSATVRIDANSLIVNNAGALYDLAGDGDFDESGFGGGAQQLFKNDGTLRKSTGDDVSRMNHVALNNSPTSIVDVRSGRLSISTNGNVWTGGTFTGTGIGVLDISGTVAVNGTLTATSPGRIAFTGTLQSSGAGATLDFPANYFQWDGGILIGSGPGITNAGFLTISGVSDVRAISLIKNTGTITHLGDVSLLFDGSTTLTNADGALYDLAGDGDFEQSGVGGGFAANVQNNGTFRKSAGDDLENGTDISIFDAIQLNNSDTGVIEVQAGKLKLNQDSVWTSGTVDVGAGAVFEIAKNLRFDTTLTGSGAGHIELTGSLDARGAASTLAFDDDYFQWLSGTIFAAGTLNNTGTLNLPGDLGKSLFRVNFVNQGTVIDSGEGTFNNDGGVITNQVGAVIEMDGLTQIVGGTITNFGTVRKVGVDTGTISSVFDNKTTGILEADAGELKLTGGGTWEHGTLNADAAATINLNAGKYNVTNELTGSGEGRVLLSGAELHGTGSFALNFAGDYFHWSGGTFSSTNLPFTNVGTINIEGSDTKLFYRFIFTNAGHIIVNGTGPVSFGDGFVGTNFTNMPGATLEFLSDAPLADVANVFPAIINNAGLIRKAAGVGTTTIAPMLNNSGTVEVLTGTLAFTDTVSQISNSTLTGGTWKVGPFSTLTMPNAGNITTNRADVTLDGQAANFTNFATLNNNQGSFALLNGGLFPTAGALTNSGVLTVGPSSVLTVNGNLTETQIPGLVGWWRGEGNATDSAGNSNGTLVGNTSFSGGQFGAAFSFDGAGDLVNVGNPTALRLQDFTISSWVKRDTNTSSLIFGYGQSGYGLGMLADGHLFLTQVGISNVQTTNLQVTDNNFHHIAVTKSGSTVRFYLDGVEELVAPYSPSFSFFTNAGIGGRADTIEAVFAGQIDEVAVFNRPLTAAQIQTIRTTNSLPSVGNVPPTVNIQIGDRPQTGLFGRIIATGAANLAGRLNIETVDGFGPLIPDQYTILTYASHTGSFAPIGGLNPFFDVNIGATQTVVSVVASAADLAVQNINVPGSAAPGEPVTIQYTVKNLDNINVVGSWFDSIYLSTDGIYDPDDLLIGRVQHTGGLAPQGSYSGTLTAALPGVVDGNYRVIVIADSRGNIGDSNRDNNIMASASQIHVDLPVLDFDTLTNLTIANGEDIYLRLDVPFGGDVLISANFLNQSQAEFFVKQGALPTRSDFDFVAGDLRDLSRSITIPSPEAGPVYILFHGREGAGVGTAMSVLAEHVEFALQEVSPDHGSNKGRATTILTGAGFTADTVVQLVDGSGNPVATADTIVISQNRLYSTFNLVGVAVGTYDVRASRPGFSETLEDAYQVVVGEVGHVRVDIVAPGAVRGGRIYAGYVNYQNVGDTDIITPIIIIESTSPLAFDLTQSPSEFSHRFLAVSPEGPAGILAPGQSVRVPYRFFGADMAVDAYSMSPDATATMDWEDLRLAIRPDDAPADWNTVFDETFIAAGDSVGDYVKLLAYAATLFQIREGETESDPDVLNGFLMGEAYADRTAVITGHVFRDELNQAAGQIIVAATNRATGEVYGASSTADGLIRMANVPPGTYDISFEGVIPPANLQPVVVPPTGLPAEQTWLVTSGGGISGRVGVPVGVELNDLEVGGSIAAVVATDAAGHRYTAGVDENRVYKFTGLPDGLYDVSFSTAHTLPVTIEDVSVVAGRTTGSIDLFSAFGAAISGTVRDADTGLPVADLTVAVTNDPDNPRFAVTDANGHYTLLGVSPGTATVAVISEGQFSLPVSGIVVSAGVTTANVDLTADFHYLGKISGTVTFGGSPLVGAAIQLRQGGQVIATTVTGSGGLYELRDVIPGQYQLTANDEIASPSTQAISLSEEQQLDVDFALLPGARVHGILSHTGADGQSAISPNLLLIVRTPLGDVIPLVTTEAGGFSLGHLGLGTYEIMLADGSHRQMFDITSSSDNLDLGFQLNTGLIIGQLFRHDGTPAEAVTVGLVANGQLVGTTSTLANGRFAVTYVDPGTYELVFDGPDEFYPKISDVVVPGEGYVDLDAIQPQSSSLNLSITDSLGGSIDADGIIFITRVDDPLGHSIAVRYQGPAAQVFDGLVPGQYLVQTGLAHFAYGQTTLDLQAGANNRTIVMTPITSVSGTVTDALHVPLGGITVSAYNPANPKIVWQATTDTNGEYVFALPAGAYTIVFADLRSGAGTTHLAQVTLTNATASTSQPLTLDAQLTEGGSTLSGTINSGSVNSVDSPPLSATVTLLTSDGVPVATVKADDNGDYQFAGLVPGNYQILVGADGYTFALVNVTLAGGANNGVNLLGKWVLPTGSALDAQAAPFAPQSVASEFSFSAVESEADSELQSQLLALSESLGAADVNTANIVDVAVERLHQIIDILLRKPESDPNRYTDVPSIPDDCPDAIAAYARVLRLQTLADRMFETWTDRWNSARKVLLVNVAAFSFQLAKLVATIVLPTKVEQVVEGVASLLARQAQVRKSFGIAVQAVEQGNLNSLNAAITAVTEFEQQIKVAIAGVQHALSLQIRPAALAGLPSTIIETYTDVSTATDTHSTLGDLKKAISEIGTWNSLADVSGFVNTAAGFGSVVLQVGELFVAAFNIAKPIPVLQPVLELVGPISEILATISQAAQGVQDILGDAEAVNQFKEDYQRAIDRRDAAFHNFLDILNACVREHNKRTKKPSEPKLREYTAYSFLVRSSDPNDIAGPEGSGAPDHFMRVDQNFPYEILFENVPTATAPAQEVVVTQQLDSDLDWSTFELGDFGFGDLIIDVPEGRNFYQTRVDLSETRGYFVDFTAGINLTTGVVTWRFTTIDPETGDVVADALSGFLPPNDASGQGQGFVQYSINPKAELTTGATITAQASIVFDDNAPLLTPVYTNKIDTGVPTSTVTALAPTQEFPNFTVSWSGVDDAAGPTGSGAATFDIFVSDNGGPFLPFLLDTSLTSATFHGQVNHTYGFYSVATDGVGFTQTTPEAAQTSTEVLDVLFDFGDAPDPLSGIAGKYPTLLANDGARHKLGSGLFLGTSVDREFDGQPNATATGDDTGSDDEDGVVFGGLVIGSSGSAAVTASAAGKLDAWIDFNHDGDWSDPGEQIATSLAVNAGSNNVTFNVPAGAIAGPTFARFRLSSAGGLGVTGAADDGEVEDYQIQISFPLISQFGQPVTWTKKDPPVAVLPLVFVPVSNLANGVLTISLNAVGSKKILDQLVIPSFTGLGSSSGPQFSNGQYTLQIQLNATASSGAIQTFLRGITFATKGKGLKSPTRTVHVTLANAAGASSTVTQTINVKKK